MRYIVRNKTKENSLQKIVFDSLRGYWIKNQYPLQVESYGH